MRAARLWRLGLAWTLGACAQDVACPADLTSSDGKSCTCPEWTETRPMPVVLPGGSVDYCLDRGPWSEGGAPGEAPTGSGVPSDGGVGTRPSGNDGTDTESTSPAPPDADPGDAGPPVSAPSDAGPTIIPPPACVATVERCDRADNDCDGKVDEELDCAPVVPPAGCPSQHWYRDCDGDGYATDAVGSAVGCDTPPPPERCRGWTKREPTAGQVDCDDNSALYSPAANFGLRGLFSTSADLNCDGRIERRIELIGGPPAAEHKPRENAPICREPMPALDSLECECFGWDNSASPDGPPCATQRDQTISVFYNAFMSAPNSPTICYSTVSAPVGIDFYQVLVTCR